MDELSLRGGTLARRMTAAGTGPFAAPAGRS